VEEGVSSPAAILGLLWGRRAFIGIVALVFAVCGAAYAFLATEWFQAQVVMVDADKKNMSSPLTQLSGLASLTGLDIGVSGTTEPLAVMKSMGFARRFIGDEDLVAPLARKRMFSFLDRKPDMRDAVAYFDQHVRFVAEDRKAGLVTLSIRWTDRDLAARWANTLVQRLNDEMQKKAEEEASRNLIFLQTELANTSVLSMQQALSHLVENEMQKAMLAKGNREFSFKVIDAAVPPKYRESPKRALVIILSAILGGVLAATFVLVGSAIRKQSG